MRKVIVIGLDGLEPKIVEPLMRDGLLPNLSRIRDKGGYCRLRTTYPPQTPVAWSTFATGVNPGGHGIYDFLRRDPATYLPSLALSRYEQKNMFTAPRAVNLRGGAAVWDLLTDAGVPSTVLRCPCTYPPAAISGRMLAGVGVPDLRGGLGTSTFYTSASFAEAAESEKVVRVQAGADGNIDTHLIGPHNPKAKADAQFAIRLYPEPSAGRALLRSDGQPAALELRLGEWSEWLHVRFKLGALQSVRGMVRFLLVGLAPHFELYASPVNFEPEAPPFAISAPQEYAGELAAKIGPYHTIGMAEDYEGLINGRFDESAYIKQCEGVVRERSRMLVYELERFEQGLLFCLFDTPDRLQHMFWRFREPSHPANRGELPAGMERVIEDHYRVCDKVIGKTLEYVDPETLLIVLSDHGMSSFRRGLNLNTWLHRQGWLALEKGCAPGEDTGEFFRHVDWRGTQAYALGLGGIFLNLAGREGQGVVRPEDAQPVKAAIAQQLTGLKDPADGQTAVASVMDRDRLYSGPFAAQAPDLLVNFRPGYRVSWSTPLGGMSEELFEDNTKKWGGDHMLAPEFVPGVLFANRPLHSEEVGLEDMAPAILAALGVPKNSTMEGKSPL